MARYEFKVVVSGVDLSREHEQEIGRAVAQAGASAVAQLTGGEPTYIPAGLKNIWWAGPYPPAILHEFQNAVRQEVGRGAVVEA